MTSPAKVTLFSETEPVSLGRVSDLSDLIPYAIRFSVARHLFFLAAALQSASQTPATVNQKMFWEPEQYVDMWVQLGSLPPFPRTWILKSSCLDHSTITSNPPHFQITFYLECLGLLRGNIGSAPSPSIRVKGNVCEEWWAAWSLLVELVITGSILHSKDIAWVTYNRRCYNRSIWNLIWVCDLLPKIHKNIVYNYDLKNVAILHASVRAGGGLSPSRQHHQS